MVGLIIPNHWWLSPRTRAWLLHGVHVLVRPSWTSILMLLGVGLLVTRIKAPVTLLRVALVLLGGMLLLVSSCWRVP